MKTFWFELYMTNWSWDILEIDERRNSQLFQLLDTPRSQPPSLFTPATNCSLCKTPLIQLSSSTRYRFKDTGQFIRRFLYLGQFPRWQLHEMRFAKTRIVKWWRCTRVTAKWDKWEKLQKKRNSSMSFWPRDLFKKFAQKLARLCGVFKWQKRVSESPKFVTKRFWKVENIATKIYQLNSKIISNFRWHCRRKLNDFTSERVQIGFLGSQYVNQISLYWPHYASYAINRPPIGKAVENNRPKNIYFKSYRSSTQYADHVGENLENTPCYFRRKDDDLMAMNFPTHAVSNQNFFLQYKLQRHRLCKACIASLTSFTTQSPASRKECNKQDKQMVRTFKFGHHCMDPV